MFTNECYYYCYDRYPYALVGELLCFMIQWGFLFYLINIYGHPGMVLNLGTDATQTEMAL